VGIVIEPVHKVISHTKQFYYFALGQSERGYHSFFNAFSIRFRARSIFFNSSLVLIAFSHFHYRHILVEAIVHGQHQTQHPQAQTI